MCGLSNRKGENNNINKLFHIQQAEHDSGRIWQEWPHWGIENSLHWVLDIGFREDESRIRVGNAAENINIARHIDVNLFKQEKSCKMGIASKRKKCGYDMDYLYKVLSNINTGME